MRRRGEQGFTLLEVLVAFAVLSVTVIALYEMMTGSLRAADRSADRYQLLALAENKLAEATVTLPIREGQEEGQFEGYYHWRKTVTVLPRPEGARPDWHRYAVTVAVWANDPKDPLELSTERLVKADDLIRR